MRWGLFRSYPFLKINLKKITIALGLLFIVPFTFGQKITDFNFIAPPYLQIGTHPSSSSLELLWHTPNEDAKWEVAFQIEGTKNWVKTNPATFANVAVVNIPAHRVYRTTLAGLVSGKMFTYRVSKNGKQIFTATAPSPKDASTNSRIVIFGDIGAGTKEAKEIANGVYNTKPDMVVVPGDIVYDNGLVSEYRSRFWPIYNANSVDSVGVPLMRSSTFVGDVGNHDADTRDLDKYPDALSYYYYWAQPINGPDAKEGSGIIPALKATDANRKAFMDAAGNAYPRMTNFSFDYGNAHWVMLDADNYVDVTDKILVDWIAKDLAESKATWKFVVFHQPGFNSSREHYEQQQMRLLAPVFEKGKVDIVLNGHVHNYQRSFPLTFTPDKKGMQLYGGKDGKTLRGKLVNGTWNLDHKYDGITNTKPNGIIYVVTGAGGQDLYNPEQQALPDTWQKFTDKFISTVNSFTVLHVGQTDLEIEQKDAFGKVLDRFKVTKL